MAAGSNSSNPEPKTREQVIAAVKSLPPLPAVALRVIAAAQDSKTSAGDLASLIGADPGLTARLLRIVNSAAYWRGREITSVHDALVMLGFVQARNIAVASAIAGSYPPDPGNALFRISSFWRHSLAVAFKASEAAARSRAIDPPTAFTTGVLHNIGRLAIFRATPAELDQAVARAITENVPLEDIEHETLGYDHSEIGGLLAAKWGLPIEIQRAIANHHSEPLVTPLTGIISDADRFCVQNGVLPGYVGAASLAPGLRPPVLDDLLKQVDGLISQINGAEQIRIVYV